MMYYANYPSPNNNIQDRKYISNVKYLQLIVDISAPHFLEAIFISSLFFLYFSRKKACKSIFWRIYFTSLRYFLQTSLLEYCVICASKINPSVFKWNIADVFQNNIYIKTIYDLWNRKILRIYWISSQSNHPRMLQY